ncbi:MAG: inositol monophosphatase [Parcubacteria group bacterium]|nr:inositol monophosphatase [Parcubacteria group bacterium]
MKNFLEQTIREAGEIAKEYFNKGVGITATKADPDDVVTEADKKLSKFFTERLHAKYPDYGIQDEEQKEVINPEAEYRWVTDPIDGTRNFAAGIPFWCHLVALRKGSETIMGAAYNPISSSYFFAEKDKGAFLNGNKIEVSKQKKIDYAFGISVGNFRRSHKELFKNIQYDLSINTQARLANYGTMLVVCHLASGGVDFIVTNGGVDHDYFFPVLLCQEAGAKVTDSDNKPWQSGHSDLVIANPILHEKLMKIVKKQKENIN